MNAVTSLYLVSTPIGNLGDFSKRGVEILNQVDRVLCEDTRDTGLLLKKYDIRQNLISCHEYNEDKIIDKIEESKENPITKEKPISVLKRMIKCSMTKEAYQFLLEHKDSIGRKQFFEYKRFLLEETNKG